MGVFIVLMWKHFTVRRRQLFQTLVELFAPISIIVVLFLLRESMREKNKPQGVRMKDSFSLDDNRIQPPMFYPNNEMTRQIMNIDMSRGIPRYLSRIPPRDTSTVNINLNTEHQTTITADSKASNTKANNQSATNSLNKSVTNSLNESVTKSVNESVTKSVNKSAKNSINESATDSLNESATETIEEDDADSKIVFNYYPIDKEKFSNVIVVFENMTGDTLPENLNYTIKYISHSLEIPSMKLFEPNDGIDENLLTLQWIIDSNFLQLKSNRTMPLMNITFKKLSDAIPTSMNVMYVNSLFYLLSYITFLSPILPFIFLMTRLLEERSTGIQELVKMVGVTPTMLGISQYCNTVPTCLLFSIVTAGLLKCTDDPMVPHSHVMILFLGLFLHFNTMIALAFACSYIAKDAQYTVSLSMFVYIGLWIPISLVEQDGKNNISLFLRGLLPHCPIYWLLKEMQTIEIFQNKGITFDNWSEQFGKWEDGGKNGSVLASLGMMLVQMAYLFTLTWYLEKVRPGRFGISLPWNFLFQKEYWMSRKKIPDKSMGASVDPDYEKYFEAPPNNMITGIQISEISKIFGSGKKQFQALKNVSLDIYKGEITVLLGHNGAGKTTLMSIITGMINQTSGKIYVDGMDTVTQQAEVRKHLGLCPQHNLFFPDLTVVEHFIFFSIIKGGTFKEARKSSMALMEQLDLTDKAHRKTSELSGGMLRRMQLGCALCGNASVLILDEPTSGLDVEARRELWDMLLALRGDRTLVLTTHFMEEADVLADRCAALHAGRLRCHATPMFLKRAVGSGLRMTIKTLDEPNEARITEAVTRNAPGAEIQEQTKNSIVYNLPAKTNMSVLFSEMEKKKEEFGIESLSVGITTLEEVFLELCGDVHKELNQSKPDVSIPGSETLIKGFPLLRRQTAALFRRQLDYTRSKLTAFIILQVFMPFFMCITLTDLFNNDEVAQMPQALTLEMYSELEPAKVFYKLDSNGRRALRTIHKLYPDIEFNNLSEHYGPQCLQCSNLYEHLIHRKKYYLGVKIENNTAKVMYRPFIKHLPNTGLNLISNILAVKTLNSKGKTINLKTLRRQANDKIFIPKSKMNCALFAIFNISILMATAITDVSLPCRERLTVARHTHIMAGASPALYWAVTFVYHITGFILFACTAAVVAAATMDKDKTIDDSDTLRAYAIATAVSGMVFYVFQYFVSFYFNEQRAGMLLIGLTIVFGFLSPILMMALDDLRDDDDPTPLFNQVMDIIGFILPAHVITDVAISMTDTSRFNSFCKHNFNLCPNMPYYTEGFDSKLCCDKGSSTKGPFNHFKFSKFAMGWPLSILVFQFFIFTTLVLLLEYRYFNRWWNTIGQKKKIEYPPLRYHDKDVAMEEEYVAQTIKLPKDKIPDTLLIRDGSKIYYNVCKKSTIALNGVNFSIKKGECFGMLGVAGAGKTTTFKLIAYEEAASRGTIFVNGCFLKANSTEYMRGMGYCPQFCGLDYFRPAAANLRMLLILRGFNNEDVRKDTYSWLDVVGMVKYSHRPVKGYSGGMVRRTATAACLCSGSPLTLLDEPTAGIDTAARRLVWAAIQMGTENDRAILLTSQSMDEMELLCNRVTILSKGEMATLGSPDALRDEIAPGYGAVIKLRPALAHTEKGQQRVLELNEYLLSQFQCVLKDEHLTSLHYGINGKYRYSEIFAFMESMVNKFGDIVEDYTVADSTLEDVFLKFSAQDGTR